MWESSCSLEVNVKGSLVPSGKGQFLYSKKTAPQNKNAVLAPAFLPDFMSMTGKAFFSQAQEQANTTFNFCLDKNNMSKKAGVKTETATGVEMCM